MKPKTIVLMVVAIGCGLGASYMTSRLLAERQTQQVETPKVSILVAKKNLDMGLHLKTNKELKELFETREFLQGEEPKDAVVSFDQLKGKYLKRTLRRGDFITTEDIGDEQTALALPEGMRAVGIRVNSETIAGGFASLPGSRVDIYCTVRRGGSQESNHCSLLLENVLVLAADTQYRRAEDVNAMPANVVTVALTPEDAMRVSLAKELGTLSLALRKFGDQSVAKREKITAKDIFNGSLDNNKPVTVVQAPVTPPVEPAPVITKNDEQPPQLAEPKGEAYEVIIWRGHHAQKIRTRLDENKNVIQDEIEVIQDSSGSPRPAPAPRSSQDDPQPQKQTPEPANPPQKQASEAANPPAGNAPAQPPASSAQSPANQPPASPAGNASAQPPASPENESGEPQN